MKKLAIITTHPIQYNAPIFKLLSERGRIELKVFYTWENAKEGFFDKKFKQEIKWDIPLLDGYDYLFVKNTAKDQGSHHRKGIINPTLISEIKVWKADAVLVYGWNFVSHFKAMRYFKGKLPVLFRGDSTLLDEQPGIKTSLRRKVLKLVYRYIDFALYVGTNNKHYYLKHGVKEEKLIFAPHAIENERFYGFDKDYENKVTVWKKEMGVKENDLVFLYAGKFEEKKDPIILIKTALNLANNNMKFIFAGDGELKTKLVEMANNNTNILFLPFINQSKMPLLYRLADVFVLPSKGPGETWGLAINEAMACSKAIVASNKVGCAIDLVKDGENGYIFEAQNQQELESILKRISKDKCKSLGEQSLEVIKNYNFAKICEAIEQIVA